MPRQSQAALRVIRNPRADNIPRPSAHASKEVQAEFDYIVKLIPIAQLAVIDALTIEKLAELRIIGRSLWNDIQQCGAHLEDGSVNPSVSAHNSNTARQNQMMSRLRLLPMNRMTRKSSKLKGPTVGMPKPWEEEEDEEA